MENLRRPYRATLSSLPRATELGSVTLPSLFLIVVLAGAMFGALSISLLWRSKATLQLRLDDCVEDTALGLKTLQSQIEVLNQMITAERIAAIAASIPSAGSSINAAKPVIEGEIIAQELLRTKWRAAQIAWIVKRGCSGKSDSFLPLPNLAWWRPLPDVLPKPLEWQGSKKAGITIRLWKGNRFSSAKVAVESEKLLANWSAEWKPFLR